jgi:2-oxoisovalerate dehydrogenase E1 component
MRAEINKALRELLEDERFLIVGESVRDPYGGAAKVTRGLSTKYPQQVIDTPISESGIVGMGLGLACQGFIPIVEIMFFDFMTLCTDQLLNVGRKLDELHGIDFKMFIRTMDAPLEYGPTHSQNLRPLLESIGIAYYGCTRGSVKRLYNMALARREKIIVMIETKSEY